ncbi:late competence protein required for DNA uptake (superfamily II DNA/RNA helicase) [Arthrobacter pascens]|uniref:hypothetical protein n=1 Tax=Arthrobacter pascens TaxID=1677 RepID=UPI002789A821|nr:hypothetical protein [Arthrobacter pascens]MDQ0633348.1 late competence protein required for DNA uptake (superfamily II DNA/RNA helicase) [Arthrobacter pascens]
MGAKRFTPAGHRLAVSTGAEVSRIEITKRREAPEWSRTTEDVFHALACDEQDLLMERGLEAPHYAGGRVVLVSVLTPRVDVVLERLYQLETQP